MEAQQPRPVQRWKDRARALKRDVHALWFAYRDPRVPRYAKVLVACIVAYALSPIDLIPDFIPVLGYLDDLLIVPLGITLAVRLVPPVVLAECREKAAKAEHSRDIGRYGAVFIGALWLFVIVWVVRCFLRRSA